MDIMFNPATAQAVCSELTGFSEELIRYSNALCNTRQGIGGSVWSGSLRDDIIQKIEGKDATLDQIATFVKNLNKTISACRRNYQIAEGTNVEIMANVTDLFM